MLLEQLKQDKQFNLLKQEVEEQKAEFYTIQNKIVETKENMQRNIKMIEALKSENEKLQSKIEQMQVSETGVIDFTNFDDYSNEINSNNRKIQVIKNIVEKFEKQIEILLLTDYSQADKNLIESIQKLYSYIFDYGLNFLFNGDFIADLNILFKCFINSNNIALSPTLSRTQEIFISALNRHIQSKLQDVNLEVLMGDGYKKQFEIESKSEWKRRERIKTLKE